MARTFGDTEADREEKEEAQRLHEAKQRAQTRQEVSTLFEIKKFTCDDCPQMQFCRWAFDAYNTDGDCLADK